MTTSHPAPAVPTYTARTPEDLLAVVPVVLGFHPQDSVVLLTFGADRPFHARVALPTTPAGTDELVEQLVAPCRRHGVRRAVVLVYSGDERSSARAARALVRGLTTSGVDVLDAIRAHEGRWYVASGPRGAVPEHGVPYDVSVHPFAAQAVLEGRVTHGSREALAETVAPDLPAVRAVTEALAQLPGGAPPVAAERAWAADLVARHVRAGSRPSDADVARLVVGMLDVAVRDGAWELMRRDGADRHERFWVDVVRRTPPGLLAAPAALLAFAAWLAGHGALAWCALDRCEEAAPGYRLAGYLAHALTHAVPPTVWDDADAG